MWKKIKSAQERKNTFRIKKELWIPVFVLMIGLVVLVNIGIRADSSQRDFIRSRAELNAVTYADHMKAEILTELLKIEGAECTICENGEEVLKAFEQSAPGDYDMILMDEQMPVMNGYEATRAIRRSSHELAKTIPIIAMTANAFSEDIQHSLAAGMNAHVSKPVEMKVLEKTIRSIKSGGGVPNRRSLYSDEWKVTGHRRIKKDS